MLSGYSRAAAMWAMHKGLHCAFATSPDDIHSTIKCTYHLLYSLPCSRGAASRKLLT